MVPCGFRRRRRLLLLLLLCVSVLWLGVLQDSEAAVRRQAASLEAVLESARAKIEEQAEQLSSKVQHVVRSCLDDVVSRSSPRPLHTHTHDTRARPHRFVFSCFVVVCPPPPPPSCLQDEVERQLHQLRADIQDAERQRVRAESAAAEAERRRAAASRERRSIEAEARQLRSRLAAAEQQLSQVKSLAMQLEGARDIQDEKLRAAAAAQEQVEATARSAANDAQAAQAAADAREAEVLQLQRALSRLDEERDVLQRELDRACEDVVAEQETAAELRQQLEAAGQAYEELKRALGDHRVALERREAEVTTLTSQLETSQARAAEALQASTVAQKEVSAAATDLASMTRENQVVSAEVMRLRVELQAKAKMVEQLTGSNAGTQRSVQELRRRYVRRAHQGRGGGGRGLASRSLVEGCWRRHARLVV